MNLTMYGKLTEEQFEKLESIEGEVDRILTERVGTRAIWVSADNATVKLVLASDSSVLCEIPSADIAGNSRKTLVKQIEERLARQTPKVVAPAQPLRDQPVKFTGVFLYVDGSDLEAIAEDLSRELKTVVGRRKDRMRVINHRSKRTADLRPEDLPDWRLGLNLDRTDKLRADLRAAVEAVAALASKYRREFVVGYFDADSGISEDVAFLKNATTAKQAMVALYSFLKI